MTDPGMSHDDGSSVSVGESPLAVDAIRSEERLTVATEHFATERVRIEKYIVTEQKTYTVDVRREEVRIIREPLEPTLIDPASVATEDPLVLILNEERVTLAKDIVPVELVRVGKERVTEHQTVSAEVLSERIEIDPAV